MIKKCYVYNNYEFNNLMKTNNWNDYNIPLDSAFISICKPGDEIKEDNITEGHWFKENHPNVINLDFYDITEESLPGDGRVRGISIEQSIELYNFIKNNIGKDFYIHCSAGQSRSQAVFRYIVTTYTNIYDPIKSMRKENPYEFSNSRVLSLLRDCWHRENNEEYNKIWEKL